VEYIGPLTGLSLTYPILLEPTTFPAQRHLKLFTCKN
jgi:hypothetical protein